MRHLRGGATKAWKLLEYAVDRILSVCNDYVLLLFMDLIDCGNET
jgi:hypothetical protein